MNAPEFKSRWLITGTFVTKTELHIGDGNAAWIDDRSRPARKNVKDKEDESDANTVCTDYLGRAYIPGSGLKGALRQLVMIPDPSDPNKKPPIIDPAWEPLLGSDKPDSAGAVGGKLEFYDAFWTEGAGPGTPDDEGESADDQTRPWWNKKRRTAVAVAVSLDRRTRTAKENLLYHLEYVPPREKFAFGIGGDNLGPEEVARLLFLLARLGDGAATLGAQASNSWGRVGIEGPEIKCLDRKGMEEWKVDPTAPPELIEIDTVTEAEIEEAKQAIALPGESRTLSIELTLSMESPWLVRDPKQRERKAEGELDAVPIRDEASAPFVPAKSLRGALRTRAEMILRTIDIRCADHPGGIQAVSTKGKGTNEVTKLIREGDGENVPPKDLAARLFGLGGWRAPLDVPRLTQTDAPADHRQEFVAIDRFTGGAADGAKFNADLAGMTTLRGALSIDLARLKEVDPECASLGLLALVLRDLAEGDIPLGSGSAKGQGFCKATVTWDGKDFLDPDCSVGGYLAKFRETIPPPTQKTQDDAA